MAEPQVRRVAVVLFEGFTVLDVYGPVQAFASTRIPRPDGSPHRLFEIVTVAEKAGPIKSGEGPTTHADYAFADAPPYDILLVPGGFGTRQAITNAPLLLALTAASRKAAITTTVCTGSALLARTGLMDNRPATSSRPPGSRRGSTWRSRWSRGCTASTWPDRRPGSWSTCGTRTRGTILSPDRGPRGDRRHVGDRPVF